MNETRDGKKRYSRGRDRRRAPDSTGSPPAWSGVSNRPLPFSGDELDRYSRHLLVPDIGLEGQALIKSARVLLVGAGGLGSPAGLYLAAAGVGRIGIVESDAVDIANLQRQVAFGTSDVGRPKIEAFVRRLGDLNPVIDLVPHAERLDRRNALEIFSGYDIVVDGSDNFATRYLVSDACVLSGKPDVFGSVIRFEGQASVFAARGGPCYRCLYPEPPPAHLVPSCSEAGVLGALPGIIGSILAAETMKLIIGRGDTLSGRLLLFDAFRARFREIEIPKDPACPMCGAHRTITDLPDYDAFCGAPGSSHPAETPEISALALKDALDAREDLLLLDVREPHEYAICNLDGILIPLAQLPGRVAELDPARDIVVYCHSGSRSAAAVDFLRRLGFPRVRNLRGGILAWADEVDPTFPKY